jgi:MtrB/PioB family decaheme-associated outer membrane protein
MRQRLLAVLCGALMLAAPARSSAQATAPGAILSSATALAQATPAPAPSQTAQQPTPAAMTGPLADDALSLFAPRDNQFQLSGRFSSVDGDTARWQRYEDLRGGLLFTDGRFLRETPDWSLNAAADNVGFRDQRYAGSYERIGRFFVNGLWDEIPQFYSRDTRTPFVSSGEGVLVLDDNAQRAANINVYGNISPQFDLRERRDIGTFSVGATPSTNLDITGHFTTTRHSGELPWGVDYGFGNDNEVALPYRSRTNDFDMGVQWTNRQAMIRAAYNGSWFNNLDDTLVSDNPLSLNDTTAAPGRGRMALWPSNSFQSLSTAGYAKLAHRTQLTGSLTFGWFNNDEPLLPFTINSALQQLPLPRATAEAAAHTIGTNLNLVSRPSDDWRVSARFRRYDYNNETSPTVIMQFINYDTSVTTSNTNGPQLFAHDRNTFDADATWSGLAPVAITFGYTNNHNGYNERQFESTNENVLYVKADAMTSEMVSFHANYEYGSRTGSGFDPNQLHQIEEQPDLRYYDLANRDRERFTGLVDVMPNEALTLSLSAGFGSDDFDDSYFGLQESDFRTVSFGFDYTLPRGVNVGASYNYERYTGLQRSRSASPGQSPPQETNPNRDWMADSKETVHYISVYVTPPRFGNTEARFSYDYAHARGDFFYTVGSALPPPSQLPQTFNKLQNLRLDVRHRLSGRLALTAAYAYEPYRIFDFAFDPSVINSIVQPSSLVLGYTYRPYTAHTGIVGIRYYW